jgi:hypothetical protein
MKRVVRGEWQNYIKVVIDNNVCASQWSRQPFLPPLPSSHVGLGKSSATST